MRPPLSYYVNSESLPLLFHLLDVGEGLMALLIFPDKTSMLYDCNVIQDEKEWIIKYLKACIPLRYDKELKKEAQWIDIYVNSHRDQDHYRGLKDVRTEFDIKSIWDSGETGATTQDDDYKYYMQLRLDLMKKYGDDAVIIPIPSRSALAGYGGSQIYCLCSSEELSDKNKSRRFKEIKEAKIQHTNSIVLLIKYAGRTILLPSDSDWKAWKEKIVPNFKANDFLRSNIMIASHHGSRSFFTDETVNETIDLKKNPENTYIESIDYVDPSIVLISCGKYESASHPNKEALKIYKEKTPKDQVYTTNEKGSFCGFIDRYGKWTMAPTRFRPSKSSSPDFDIQCYINYKGKRFRGMDGGMFPIGCSLDFSVLGRGGLTDPFPSIKVVWEVSNGGINSFHECQDIYYKKTEDRGNKLEFHRDVAYEGKHLLRCRVINKKKGYDLTKIFIVNGCQDKGV
jgi:beta-lactamase superfamily II metal-dependent hydrolase